MFAAARIAMRYSPPSAEAKSDGFHTWTDDEIALFEAHHSIGSKPRLALALLLYTAHIRTNRE
jgi:hypothetical protein